MVPKSSLELSDGGLEPAGPGWFVLNVRDARWLDGHFGAYTRFEGKDRFPSLGFNIGVLEPGQPSCMYHGEDEQEDFLVLSGECLLLIEGTEQRLKAWDFVHCPPWTEHVFVGAGDGPSAVLMIGSRRLDEAFYPVDPVAAKYDASVERETSEPAEAYAEWRREPRRPAPNPWPLG
jgi:uncharacterized cupin superfamily protein